MKRSKTSKQWMREHVNDVYVQRARKEGYRSRAAYKLLEIAARDKLLRPGMVVVDLGAAPGGWSQVARTQVGARGLVFALDLLEMEPLPGVKPRVFCRGKECCWMRIIVILMKERGRTAWTARLRRALLWRSRMT